MTASEPYYGKYRGTVIQNIDPELRGRLQVEVPDVMSVIPSTWAEPCVPLAGVTGFPMGIYVVPPIGAAVWVEFEHGDPNLPIWTGCRFPTSADVPPMALAGLPTDANIVMQSLAKHMVMISDMPPTPATGGIVLQSFTGAYIVVNDSGIYLNNNKGATISMVGPQIDLNFGALTILK
jgi:hypothetical protein